MTAGPRFIALCERDVAAQRALDELCRRMERARAPGTITLPPGVADTTANRWACARAGLVEGWVSAPEPTGDGNYTPGVYLRFRAADGCPGVGIGECLGLGCDRAGRCMRHESPR